MDGFHTTLQSNALFSLAAVEENLSCIFEDSIILSTQFVITGVSPGILQILGYGLSDLTGQKIDCISQNRDWENLLSFDLRTGSFGQREYIARTRQGQSLTFGISGFYLGLISEINGYIILRIRNLNEVKMVDEQLSEKALELDYFMYRIWHDLRGPLASLMGLLNIIPLANSESEKSRYVREATLFAQKVDATLKNMLYVAQADLNDTAEETTHNPAQLEGILREIIQEQEAGDLQFVFHNHLADLPVVNPFLLEALLRNLLIAILELPKNAPFRKLVVTVHSNKQELVFTFAYLGFRLDRDLADQITRGSLSCADILKNGPFVRFYAARKVLKRLNGHIHPIVDVTHQQILVSIPVKLPQLIQL